MRRAARGPAGSAASTSGCDRASKAGSELATTARHRCVHLPCGCAVPGNRAVCGPASAESRRSLALRPRLSAGLPCLQTGPRRLRGRRGHAVTVRKRTGASGDDPKVPVVRGRTGVGGTGAGKAVRSCPFSRWGGIRSGGRANLGRFGPRWRPPRRQSRAARRPDPARLVPRPAQQPLDPIGCRRPREVVALGEPAAQLAQPVELARVLHALGDDLEVQRPAHGHDGARELPALGLAPRRRARSRGRS